MIILCWYVHIWNQLCPKTVVPCYTTRKITLNILCPSHPHQQLFDKIHIARLFDCETNTIVYHGTCVVENVKSKDWLYWLTHGDPWGYIFPIVENYHYHSVYINKTREEQEINTVGFSQKSTMPCMPLGDARTCTAHYVAQLLLTKSCQPHAMY